MGIHSGVWAWVSQYVSVRALIDDTLLYNMMCMHVGTHCGHNDYYV